MEELQKRIDELETALRHIKFEAERQLTDGARLRRICPVMPTAAWNVVRHLSRDALGITDDFEERAEMQRCSRGFNEEEAKKRVSGFSEFLERYPDWRPGDSLPRQQ